VPLDDVADFVPAPETGDDLDRQDALRLLDRLNPNQRAVVAAISVEGKSPRETAQALNLSEGAVRVTLHRGLKVLAALYQRTRP
jgi:RNA polymerase sigma-70 factor (ECF subfamily)